MIGPMRHLLTALLPFLLVAALASGVSDVYAQSAGSTNGGNGGGKSPSQEVPTKMGIIKGDDRGCNFDTGKIKPACLNHVIANAIEVVFAFSGAICLLNIILAGYQIAIGNVTGSGDTAGKDRLRWALIGFFICAASFGIINAALDAIA